MQPRSAGVWEWERENAVCWCCAMRKSKAESGAAWQHLSVFAFAPLSRRRRQGVTTYLLFVPSAGERRSARFYLLRLWYNTCCCRLRGCLKCMLCHTAAEHLATVAEDNSKIIPSHQPAGFNNKTSLCVRVAKSGSRSRTDAAYTICAIKSPGSRIYGRNPFSSRRAALIKTLFFRTFYLKSLIAQLCLSLKLSTHPPEGDIISCLLLPSADL